MPATNILKIQFVLLVTMAGCAAGVEEYSLSAEQSATFQASAHEIRFSEDPDSPLASLMWPSNQVGAPLGVQIWSPDPVLGGLGIRNGDVIASIDGVDPYSIYEYEWRNTGKPFTPGQFNQGPNHAEAEKYEHFVLDLIERIRAQGSVTLEVHQRYYKREDVAEHGQYAAEPRWIRLVWLE